MWVVVIVLIVSAVVAALMIRSRFEADLAAAAAHLAP